MAKKRTDPLLVKLLDDQQRELRKFEACVAKLLRAANKLAAQRKVCKRVARRIQNREEDLERLRLTPQPPIEPEDVQGPF